jgi:hypothetical protein
MALAERTEHAPTPQEHAVDVQLAHVLDHLVGAVDGLPASEQPREPRPQPQSYGFYRLQERSFLGLLRARLLYSQRLPYRIARLFAVLCAAAGSGMMLARFLALG